MIVINTIICCIIYDICYFVLFMQDCSDGDHHYGRLESVIASIVSNFNLIHIVTMLLCIFKCFKRFYLNRLSDVIFKERYYSPYSISSCDSSSN